jgi:hypothetical protein
LEIKINLQVEYFNLKRMVGKYARRKRKGKKEREIDCSLGLIFEDISHQAITILLQHNACASI